MDVYPPTGIDVYWISVEWGSKRTFAADTLNIEDVQTRTTIDERAHRDARDSGGPL